MNLKDVKKQLNDNRMKMWLAETDPKVWKKKSETEKKKWTEEFVKFNQKAWEDVYDNTVELDKALKALKSMSKDTLDQMESLLVEKRKAPEPMTSGDQKLLHFGDAIFENYDQTIEKEFGLWSAHTPEMKYRGEYFKDLVSNDAISTTHVTAIKQVRAKGIDLSDTWGKNGKERARLLEYPQRWETLKRELANIHKAATGGAAQVEKDVAEQLGRFAKDFHLLTALVEQCVQKVNEKIPNAMNMLDKQAPTGFVASLRKVVSDKYAEQQEKELFNQMVGLNTALGVVSKLLKDAKGKVKTKRMEFRSLEAQVLANPTLKAKFAKALTPVSNKFEEFEQQFETLTISLESAADVVSNRFPNLKN